GMRSSSTPALLAMHAAPSLPVTAAGLLAVRWVVLAWPVLEAALRLQEHSVVQVVQVVPAGRLLVRPAVAPVSVQVSPVVPAAVLAVAQVAAEQLAVVVPQRTVLPMLPLPRVRGAGPHGPLRLRIDRFPQQALRLAALVDVAADYQRTLQARRRIRYAVPGDPYGQPSHARFRRWQAT